MYAGYIPHRVELNNTLRQLTWTFDDKKVVEDASIKVIEDGDKIWKINEPFADILKLICECRGRSAAYIQLESVVNGNTYFMTFSDFFALAKAGKINRQGVIEMQQYCFKKTGGNYYLTEHHP